MAFTHNNTGAAKRALLAAAAVFVLCCALCACFLLRPFQVFASEGAAASNGGAASYSVAAREGATAGEADSATFQFPTGYDDNPSTHPSPSDYRYGVATYEQLSVPAGVWVQVKLPDGTTKEAPAEEVAEYKYFEDTYFYEDYYLNNPDSQRYTRGTFTYEKNDDGTPTIVDDTLVFTMQPAVKQKQLVRYTGLVQNGDGSQSSQDMLCYVAWGNTITVAGGSATEITFPVSDTPLEYYNPASSDPAKHAAYQLSWDSTGNATLSVVEYGVVQFVLTYPDENGQEQTLTLDANATYIVDGEPRTLGADTTLTAPGREPDAGYGTIGYALSYSENNQPVFTTTSGSPKEYSIFYTYDTDSWADKEYDSSGAPIAAPTPKQQTSSTTYHTGEAVELMQPPSRWEYIFLGWYVSDDGGKTVKAGVSSIDAGTYGDIQFYAAWVKCWDVSFSLIPETNEYAASYTSLAPVENTQIPIELKDAQGKAVLDNSLKAVASFVPEDGLSGGMGYKYSLRASAIDVFDTSQETLYKTLVSLGVTDRNISAAYNPTMFTYRLNSGGVTSNEAEIDSGFGSIALSISVPKDSRNYRYHIYQFTRDGSEALKVVMNQAPDANGYVTITLTSLSPIVLVKAGMIQDGDPEPGDDNNNDDTGDHTYTDVEKGSGPVDSEVDPGTLGTKNATRNTPSTSAKSAAASASLPTLPDTGTQRPKGTYLNEVPKDEPSAAAPVATSWLTEHGPLVTGVALGSTAGLLGAGLLIARLRTKADYKHFW